ncbi:hypothetical protein OOU_Y34scaffold00726g19 [Pyricularia oryzae Y34]|uniref:Uncharacterized protein n=1 Tax=Pyricularia oryzae (strain Y34) TaxID=1143189 RepID=A0AA97NRH3_PYRO3|nr:hypothetical protein OOU_Y34scaffold00726g19 [Pyricularia oryzae Y34]
MFNAKVAWPKLSLFFYYSGQKPHGKRVACKDAKFSALAENTRGGRPPGTPFG